MCHSFMNKFNCPLSAYRVVWWYGSTEYFDFSQTFRTLQGVIMESNIQDRASSVWHITWKWQENDCFSEEVDIAACKHTGRCNLLHFACGSSYFY